MTTDIEHETGLEFNDWVRSTRSGRTGRVRAFYRKVESKSDDESIIIAVLMDEPVGGYDTLYYPVRVLEVIG